ncbi:MAG: ParB N-terminal domain-containing protein [Clostridiales Family XIII bacterium]|jgi:ParB family chromosome partitioning protein|nr:ParB N-terminal domain-containing protein [Clostridiales Family XIII bacterium]
MVETGFKLRSFGDIFTPTEPGAKSNGDPVRNLPLERLQPYKKHPFRPYEGQRFDDMIRSIRENGVLAPIIVRPVDDLNYEILSGHNRTKAAKAAGLERIPAIVREGLTDGEAMLIVTETNLLQRSFADLSHSERAVTLSMHHEAIKRQGRRTDLVREIENMVGGGNGKVSETSVPLEQKSNARERMAREYGLDSGVIARYLRIEKLIGPLKTRLDDNEFALYAAVALSYLTQDEQRTVDDVLDASHRKLDIKKAEALRAAKNLDRETAERILAGEKRPRAAKAPAFKLKPKIVSRYFTPSQKAAEIEAIIIEALEFFYAHKNPEREAIPHGDENIPANDAAGKALPPEVSVGQRRPAHTAEQSGLA